MPMFTTTIARRPLLAGAAVALVAAVAVAQAAASARTRVTPPAGVSIAGNGSKLTISGPTRWRPGDVRVAAASRGGEQEFTLLRLHAGYGYARFLADGARAGGSSPAAAAAMRRVFANTDFLGGANVFPGAPASFTVRVEPGTYYLGEMSGRPVFRRIVVAGAARIAAPSAGAVVTAYDFGFRSSTPALPARGTITIRNTGTQIHRLLLVPVRTGTTRAQIGAYLRKVDGRPYGPPPAFAGRGPQLGTAMISPGRQLRLGYSLPPGEYALLCFQPDARTGRPQALEGMYSTAILR